MKKQNGPWAITDSHEVYKNPWIRVREDQVVRPDGKDGIYAVVEMVSGVSVLPIDNDGFVYLTHEFKYAVENISIEVISGGIDEGEEPLTAAKRELKEEVGLIATDWIDLGLLHPFTSVINSPAHLYIAKELTTSKAQPEGTEKIEILKIKLEEAVQMVMDSKITHGQSVALILKADRYLGG